MSAAPRFPIAPSATSLGTQWIVQFSDEDKPAARLLIDSLRIVSENELRSAILDRLDNANQNFEHPIIILPVRNLNDFTLDKKGSTKPAAYDQFNPGAHLQPLPGSEGVIANIIRQFYGVRRKTPGLLAPDSTLAVLRKHRCRTILLVTDYTGTGSQCLDMINSILRNPSIRSWRSFRWIKVSVLAFTAAELAITRLRSSGRVDKLDFVETAESFSTANWTPKQAAAVEEICVKYADPVRRTRNEALGYRGSRGLTVMQHGVPNNLPAILLQTRNSNEPWTAPFPNRTFPAALQRDIAGYRPRQTMELARQVPNDPELIAALTRKVDGTQRPYLMTLGAIAARNYDVEQMANALATSTIQVAAITAALHSWGLIDARNHLSDQGWQVLRRLRMRPRKITFSLNGSDEPYYPMQLR